MMGGTDPGLPVEPGAESGRQAPPQIERKAAAGHVREALYGDRVHQHAHGTDVDPGRGHQPGPEGRSAVERGGEGRVGHLEDLAHERESVRVQSARCEADDPIAGMYVAAVHDAILLDDAEAESGEVEVLARIDPGHFGALASDQRRARDLAAPGDSLDHHLGGRQLEPAHGQVVQEQDRLGALREHVVRAHRHQIDPDRLVARRLHRQSKFGSDAVRGGDQHRASVTVGRQPVQRCEPADPADHARPVGSARYCADPIDEPAAPVDVDSRVPVSQ